jgi:hypothetical protein
MGSLVELNRSRNSGAKLKEIWAAYLLRASTWRVVRDNISESMRTIIA